MTILPIVFNFLVIKRQRFKGVAGVLDWLGTNTIEERIFIFDIIKIQMKPTKEQMKIILKKLLVWLRGQNNEEQNNVSTKEEIYVEEKLHEKSAFNDGQVENEKQEKKLSRLQRELMKSRIIATANKNPKYKEILIQAIEKSEQSKKNIDDSSS